LERGFSWQFCRWGSRITPQRPPGSLFDVYTRNLEEASCYALEDCNLYITYGTDTGILKFAK